MITRILVPTDFSAVADNALQYAIQLAEATGAELDLLHTIQVPVSDAYFVAGSYPTLMSSLEQYAASGFAMLKEKLYKETTVRFHAFTAVGSVCDETLAYAKKQKTDLIVMGTLGASGITELLFGSNTANVISRSEIPVLVIPPKATYRVPQHIVYATDHNEPEFPAVSRLFYLAELFDAKVTVLHIQTEYDQYFDSEKNFFVKNKANISNKNWKIVKVDENNLLEDINQFIKENNADMVVVAKHNRSFFDRIFHRSMSKQMAYHTIVPLLVLNKSEK